VGGIADALARAQSVKWRARRKVRATSFISFQRVCVTRMSDYTITCRYHLESRISSKPDSANINASESCLFCEEFVNLSTEEPLSCGYTPYG
jgi:hypothetical protein